MKRAWIKRSSKSLKRRPFKRSRTRVKDKKRQESVSSLKKRLDAVFSLWIRNRDRGVCYTCGVQKPIKQMQNGHYISRSHSNTRYDELNCHCQCVACNVFKHGNMDAYAFNLMEEFGGGILQELNKRKQVIKQFTKNELQELITKYSTIPNGGAFVC